MNKHREKALLWLRSLAFGSLVYWALMSMGFNPVAGAAGAAIAIMLLAFFSAGLAVFAALIALSLPIIASNLLLGAIFLVIALAAIQYLAYDHGINFLLIVGGMAAVFAGPAWALPIFAGYLLGASQGAVVAILVCLLIEAVGLSVSAPVIGFIYTGAAEGAPPLINTVSVLPTLAGLSISAAELDPSAVLRVMAQAQPGEILVIQPLLWGLGAAITGAVCRMKLYRRVVMVSIGTVAGVAVLAVGHMALTVVFFGTQPDYLTVISAAVISTLLALAGIAASEYLFPPVPKQVAPATPLSGLRSEEADVDDLLRLIATAEDELMARHTTHSVVMLTDMKAFSKMTDEDGSVASAKTIQRLRDLLVPIIDNHGGKGKSTGGDGLVAAFGSASEAAQAAIQMQNVLAEQNDKHPSMREMSVRIGIADGEVVLDAGGRPFIGAALNLAARVMDMADGGQIFTTREIAKSAGLTEPAVISRGRHLLKNISAETEVVEVIWRRG